MISGTGATSLRKQDLTDQKNIGTGFVKTQFAHQCSGGETGINLNSLTLPSQMSANGFVNPTGAQLAAVNLTTYRKNLKLVSSLRGQLVDFLSYTVSATGTQINLVGFTASPGEIFVGTIDYTAVNGVQVVSATGQPATGVLAAGTTDFNIGFPVPTNQYSTTQLGGVLVYLDGVLQTRNTGNSSTVTDGNYYEVDNGSGNFSVVRFNVSDPVNARNVLVVPNGLLVPQPDGSLLTTVQVQAGQINQLSQYVASLTGLSQSTVLGGAASYTDLLAFGNRVSTIEGNRARIDLTNVWTAYQRLVGRTDGGSPASGEVCEELKQTRVQSAGISLTASDAASNVTASSLSLTPGVWEISGEVAFDTNTTTETVFRAGISNLAGAGSATFPGGDTIGVADTSGQKRAQIVTSAVVSSSSITVPILPYRYSVSTSQTMFLVGSATYTGTAPKVYGTIRAIRIA